MKSIILWSLFIFLSIAIGLYPLAYYFSELGAGFLSGKPDELRNSLLWQIAFNIHITVGGISLLTGWAQFSSRLRTKYLNLHRLMGKIYLFCFILCNAAGLSIGFFATGGWISKLGFISMASIALTCTIMGYRAIVKKDILQHQLWMTYSFAACFGAVTLRLWLPLLVLYFQDFLPAYRIVAWLSWVPNLLVAYWINMSTLSRESGKNLASGA
jgi:hypothetical protein